MIRDDPRDITVARYRRCRPTISIVIAPPIRWMRTQWVQHADPQRSRAVGAEISCWPSVGVASGASPGGMHKPAAWFPATTLLPTITVTNFAKAERAFKDR